MKNTKIKYEYVTEDGEYPHDAVSFMSCWSTRNKEYIADDAAEHYYNMEDDSSQFPLTFEIYKNGKSLGRFEVAVEFEPTFSAAEV